MTGSLNFCGGCNPKIDRVVLAEDIKKALIDRGIKVVYNEIDADFAVYISGCSVNCAARLVEGDKFAVIIAGSTVNAHAVSDDCMATIAIQKIEDFIAKKDSCRRITYGRSFLPILLQMDAFVLINTSNNL